MKRVNSLRRIFVLVAAMNVFAAIWPQLGRSQPTGMQPEAEKLLRRMGEYLAGRQQFSLKAENTIEAVLATGQKVQFDSPATLTLSRPNKLRAHRRSDITNQELFYDGKTLSLYILKENMYDTTAAPGTLYGTFDCARGTL